jgi:integrase
MASLEKRGGKFRIIFRLAGRKYARALKTPDPRAARAAVARLEDNLRRVELGTLDLPDDVDVVTYLLSDGKSASRPNVARVRTLEELCEAFFASLPSGSVEDSTIKGMQIHVRHLQAILGCDFPVQSLRLDDLQRYVETRSYDDGLRGRAVTGTTIKKDIVTFTTIWSWAVHAGIFKRPFPKRGLKYPKTTEKPPFQTIAQIQARISRGNHDEGAQADLWGSAFLTLADIEELLAHVATVARHPFLWPMFVFAAHTGARRSEIIRSQVHDLDFASGTILIHEKKRVRGKSSTRRVPMSNRLTAALTAWLQVHPGGDDTFCLPQYVVRSKTSRSGPTPITPDEAHDFFKRTLANTKWSKLRGWHVFRHSFCSNCAAKGVDQRIINAWVGHQTEEMVRRYRHLLPNQEQAAIQAVFGPIAAPSATVGAAGGT